MKLGHKLGLGCMGLIIGTFVLIMVVVIRNKPTPEQQSASNAQRDGYTAAFTCQGAVRDRLKAPATAEFQAPRNAEIKRYDSGNYEIVSYVDAQNSFGAKLRSPYTCVVAPSGAGFQVLELKIDGR